MNDTNEGSVSRLHMTHSWIDSIGTAGEMLVMFTLSPRWTLSTISLWAKGCHHEATALQAYFQETLGVWSSACQRTQGSRGSAPHCGGAAGTFAGSVAWPGPSLPGQCGCTPDTGRRPHSLWSQLGHPGHHDTDGDELTNVFWIQFLIFSTLNGSTWTWCSKTESG